MQQTFGADSIELLIGGIKAPCVANAAESTASLDHTPTHSALKAAVWN